MKKNISPKNDDFQGIEFQEILDEFRECCVENEYLEEYHKLEDNNS